MLHSPDINFNKRYEYELILCRPNKEETAYINYFDLTYTPVFLEYNELNFSIYREITIDNNINDGKYNETHINPNWEQIYPDYLILLNIKTSDGIADEIIHSEYFVIESPDKSSDGSDTMSFHCYSYEKVFLGNNTLSGFKDSIKRLYDPDWTVDENDKLPKGILNYIIKIKFNYAWEVAHIDGSVLARERVLSFTGSNLKTVFDSLSESFHCAFVFDNKAMKIYIYEREIGMLGENKGLIIADDNYAASIKYQEDNTDVKTRVYVYGKNEATLAKYNPTGQLYTDDFHAYMTPVYMSEELINALADYNSVTEENTGVFTDYVNRLDAGDESVIPLIEELRLKLAWENNFTEIQIKELTSFIKEDFVTVSTISDSKELYEYARRHLRAIADIPIQIDIDAVDIFSLNFAQSDWLRIKVGDFVNVYRKELNLEYKEIRLISYSHNPVRNTLRLSFSNRDGLVTTQWKNNMFFKSYEFIQNQFYYNQLSDPSVDLTEVDKKIDETKNELKNDIANISTVTRKFCWDYNVQPIIVRQKETILAQIEVVLSQSGDGAGEFTVNFTSNSETDIIFRLYDNGIQELQSPKIEHIRVGKNIISFTPTVINRLQGVHTFTVTAQVREGYVNIGTRNVDYRVEFICADIMPIAYNIQDVTVSQPENTEEPKDIFSVAIENGDIIVSSTPFTKNAKIDGRNFFENFKIDGVDAIKAACEFRGKFINKNLFTKDLYIFWINSEHECYAQQGNDYTTRIHLMDNCKEFSVCQGW